ncbi:MAG: hypothetical protein COA83_09930 [Methylophaga sp.]|nr:MAG: hypothetical protein COA83_09930 [Methylophaga sp.]
MEHLSELIGLGILGLVGWFASSVLAKMDKIHFDLKNMAIQHGERLAKLEVVSHPRCRKE